MTRNNLSPLPWFTDITRQGYRRSYAYGKLFPNGAPMHQLLPFQLPIVTQKAVSIKSVTLQYLDGGYIDVTADILKAGLVVKNYIATHGYNVIVFPCNSDWLSRPVATAGRDTTYLHEGYAFLHLQLVRGSGDAEEVLDYYSEVMSLVSSTYGYLSVEWQSLTDVLFDGGRIVYDDVPSYINRLYLRAEVGLPEYEFNEDGEDRNGYFFATKQTSEKKYHFSFLATEEMCDAMRIIGMSDIITVTDTDGRVYHCDTFLMTPSWQEQGYLAAVDCEFQTDTVVVRPANAIEVSTIAVRFYNSKGEEIKTLSVGYGQSEEVISISPNFKGTSVISNVDWLKVNEFNGEIRLIADTNSTGASRNGTITAMTPYGKVTTLSVLQGGTDVYNLTINVTPVDAYLTVNGAVQSLVNGSVTLSLSPGLANIQVYRAGYTSKTIAYTMPASDATLDIALPATSTLEVSSTTLSLAGASNSTATFDITSNSSWTIAVSNTWVKVSRASGTGNATITVTTSSANTTGASRSLTLTIKTADGATQTITATQATGESEGGTTTDTVATFTPLEQNISLDDPTALFTVSDPCNHGWGFVSGGRSFYWIETWEKISGNDSVTADEDGARGTGNAVIALKATISQATQLSSDVYFYDKTKSSSKTYPVLNFVDTSGSTAISFIIASVSPSNATVYINGKETKRVDCYAGDTITVLARADGYKEYTATYTMGTSSKSVNVTMEKEDTAVEVVRPSVTTTVLSFDKSGGSKSVAVTDADNVGWVFYSDSDWIQISGGASYEGSGSKSGISISASENTGAERNGNILFGDKDGTISTITVTQAKAATLPAWGVADKTASVGADGGKITVSVNDADNIGWDVSVSPSTIGAEIEKFGTGVVVTFPANTGSARSATINLTSTDGGIMYDTITVTQAATLGNPATIVQNTNEYTHKAQSEVYPFVVTDSDNTGWSIDDTAEWTTIDGASKPQKGSGLPKFAIDENTGTSTRSTTVTFVPVIGSSQKFTITQKGIIKATPTALSFDWNGNQKSIKITAESGRTYTLSTATDWIAVGDTTSKSYTGSGTATIAIFCDANDSVSDGRSGSLTLLTDEGDRVIIPITQAAYQPTPATVELLLDNPENISYKGFGKTALFQVTDEDSAGWKLTMDESSDGSEWLSLWSMSYGSEQVGTTTVYAMASGTLTGNVTKTMKVTFTPLRGGGKSQTFTFTQPDVPQIGG